MGISGLLPFLQKSSRPIHISEMKGKTVAVDSYCWLHKGAFGCSEKLAMGEDTNGYVLYCLKFLKLLQLYRIRVIMVFDGQHLPAKAETEKKRREQRQLARKRATELLRLGKSAEARNFLKQCVDISHDMALALIKECRKINVDCIVAPYEADAQLAYLNLQGIVDFVITEDSDLVLFGCDKILFKFDLNGNGTLVEADKLYISMDMRPDMFTFDKFRYMCILSGCDYISSLPGIGLKKAQKFIKMTADPNIHNVLSKLPCYLKMKHLTITEEYKEDFMCADATFKHQLVYDPIKRKQVHMTDPNNSGTDFKYLKNVGKFLDEETAFQLALGNLNPFTHEKVDDWLPNYSDNVLSIWNNNKPRQEHLTKNNNAKSWSVKVNVEEVDDKSDFDARLKEELQVYYTLPVDAMVQSEKDNSKNSEEDLSPILNSKSNNPFSKRRKVLSKFNVTQLDTSTEVKSRYFGEENDKKRKKDESKNTSDDSSCLKTLSENIVESVVMEKLSVAEKIGTENVTPELEVNTVEKVATKRNTIYSFSKCKTVGLSRKVKKTESVKQPTLLNFFSKN